MRCSSQLTMNGSACPWKPFTLPARMINEGGSHFELRPPIPHVQRLLRLPKRKNMCKSCRKHAMQNKSKTGNMLLPDEVASCPPRSKRGLSPGRASKAGQKGDESANIEPQHLIGLGSSWFLWILSPSFGAGMLNV